MKIRMIAIRLIVIVLLMVSLASAISAQEATEEPVSGPVMADAWEMINLDADADDDSAPRYVVFLWLDDGETLLEVAPGVDMIYTRGEDDAYAGTPLVPTDAFANTSTLAIIDEDTYAVTSVTESGAFSYETNLRYERTDMEIGVWVEGERDLTEFSLFGECLGAFNPTPPTAWANPDPIVAIGFDEDAGTMRLGNTVLTGDGSTYELEEDRPFGQFMQVITQTATVSDDVIAFTYYAIADERDNCELTYDTTFVPFDGDFDALFDRANALAEPED